MASAKHVRRSSPTMRARLLSRRKENTVKQRSIKKWSKNKVDTRFTSLVVWPSPYACAQPYYHGGYQATMESSFGLYIEPHQQNRLYTCRSDKTMHKIALYPPLSGEFTLRFCPLDPYQFSSSTVRIYSRSKFAPISTVTENIEHRFGYIWHKFRYIFYCS